ncbi:MAG: phosphoribosyl-ATP diphosphatase [Flavobacteriales bacterium AspAUS03]
MKTSKLPIKDHNDLMTVILQDHRTRVVLNIGKMNQRAWEETMKDGYVHLAQSQQKIDPILDKCKLQVKDFYINETKDVLLIQVIPTKKYKVSAWGEANERLDKINFINELEKIIDNRWLYDDEKSYTSSLFRSGLNKIVQKVGEEATEFIIEAKDQNNDKAFLNEGADLIFHFLVLLNTKGFLFKDIVKVLKKRQQRGKITHKIENLRNKIHK